MAEEVAFGEGSQDVVVYEFEYFFLLGILLQTGFFDVGVDHYEIFLAFAGQSGSLILLVSRHVFEQQFPGLATML